MSLPLCEICQEHKASILICLEQEGQTEKHHVCMDCVGEIAHGKMKDLLDHDDFDLSKLTSILHHMQNWQEPQEAEIDSDEIATLHKLQAMMGEEEEADGTPKEPQCPECGTSWRSIHEDGLVGCPHCYVTFAEPLQEVMVRLHHNTAHNGKVPRFREKQERLKEHQAKREKHRQEMLQRRLETAVGAEDYEEAAQIRDKMARASIGH